MELIMINTVLISSKEEFRDFQKKCWISDEYTTYYIGTPEHFPCIGIEEYDRLGDLGSAITIETFVYLEDFEK